MNTWRMIVLVAAVIILPHFFHHEELTGPVDHRAGHIPDNTCTDALPPDGSPMECKWVYTMIDGQKCWIYTRGY